MRKKFFGDFSVSVRYHLFLMPKSPHESLLNDVIRMHHSSSDSVTVSHAVKTRCRRLQMIDCFPTRDDPITSTNDLQLEIKTVR